MKDMDDIEEPVPTRSTAKPYTAEDYLAMSNDAVRTFIEDVLPFIADERASYALRRRFGVGCAPMDSEAVVELAAKERPGEIPDAKFVDEVAAAVFDGVAAGKFGPKAFSSYKMAANLMAYCKGLRKEAA